MYLLVSYSKTKLTKHAYFGIDAQTVVKEKTDMFCHGVYQTVSEAEMCFIDLPNANEYKVISLAEAESYPIYLGVVENEPA